MLDTWRPPFPTKKTLITDDGVVPTSGGVTVFTATATTIVELLSIYYDGTDGGSNVVTVYAQDPSGEKVGIYRNATFAVNGLVQPITRDTQIVLERGYTLLIAWAGTATTFSVFASGTEMRVPGATV